VAATEEKIAGRPNQTCCAYANPNHLIGFQAVPMTLRERVMGHKEYHQTGQHKESLQG
jgi:hypothetical protein